MEAPSPELNVKQPTSNGAEATARAWVETGRQVMLQGTVVHTRASRTIALYCASGAVMSMVGLARPKLALAGLAVIVLSAVIDLDGGPGWLRNLLPRRPSHNVVAWPTKDHGPLLLITAALEPEIANREFPTWLLRIPLALLAIPALGCVLGRHPDVARATLLTGALCLILVSLFALCWRILFRPHQIDNPARAALEMAIPQIERANLKRLRCSFALIGGERSHHDGLQTLLVNHKHRFRPDSTRVLVLHPGEGLLGAVHHEGRVRRQRSDNLLVNAMRRLGLAGRTRTTGASRAQRAGWRAAAMLVSPEQTHAAAGAVTKLVQQFDQSLIESEDPE